MLKFVALSLIFVVSTLAAKIVGGGGIDIRYHPYQVSLQMKYGSTTQHVCGGSIIKKDVILTAAHCIGNYRAENFIIAAGSSKLNDPNAVRRNVSGILKHERFNAVTFDYDIALIFIEKALPLNQNKIKTIGLATQAPPPNYWAGATGWGDTSHGGYASNYLLHVYLLIVNNDRCRKDFSPFYGPDRVTSRMICAGYAGVGGKGVCHGDSGGPLTFNGFLVGVTSWGIGCGRPDVPSVFANVAHFNNWIMRCS